MASAPLAGGIAISDSVVTDESASSLPQRIVLTGFMGAGKSTVGRLLAGRLGWQFLDIDNVIEAAHGATVAEIFAERGEPWFRAEEHAAICRLLGTDHLVLALGGGAIEDPRTRELLLGSAGTRLIHLEASLETVRSRCSGTEDIRPVLRDTARLESRYSLRLPLYRLAHVSIPVDALTPEAVVSAVLGEFGKISA